MRVVISTSPVLEIAEAIGEDVGCARVTTVKIGIYGTYSPFPVFSDFSPSSGTVVTSSHPVISFIINSGTGISASTGVVVRLDGTEIQPTITSPEAKKYRVTYTPEVGLANGRHVLHVWATNSMGLEEGAEHYFNVSETEHIEFGMKDSTEESITIIPQNTDYGLWAYDRYAGIRTITIHNDTGTVICSSGTPSKIDFSTVTAGCSALTSSGTFTAMVTNGANQTHEFTFSSTSTLSAMRMLFRGAEHHVAISSTQAMNSSIMVLENIGCGKSDMKSQEFYCNAFKLSVMGVSSTCLATGCGGGTCCYSYLIELATATPLSFTVTNATTTYADKSINMEAHLFAKPNHYWLAGVNVATRVAISAGSSTSGSVFIPGEYSVITRSPDGIVNFLSLAMKLIVEKIQNAAAYIATAYNNYLKPVSGVYSISTGYSEHIYFDRSATISFIVTPPTPSLCAQGAIKIYSYDGDNWESDSITNQTVTPGANGSCTITGNTYHASPFGVFYNFLEQDALPPRSFIGVTAPAYSTGTTLYIGDHGGVQLSAVDDKSYPYDGEGTVQTTYYAVDSTATALSAATTAQFSVYSGTFTISTEGAHVVKYGSLDTSGNYETLLSSTVYVDLTPPALTMKVNGVAVSTSVPVFLVSGSTITFEAADPLLRDGAPGSGIKGIYYLSSGETPESCHFNEPGYQPDPQAAPGTCANPVYSGAFSLYYVNSPYDYTTYSIYVVAADNAGNQTAGTYGPAPQ